MRCLTTLPYFDPRYKVPARCGSYIAARIAVVKISIQWVARRIPDSRDLRRPLPLTELEGPVVPPHTAVVVEIQKRK